MTDNRYGPNDSYGAARVIAEHTGIPRIELIWLLLAGKIKGYQGGCDYWIDLLSLREHLLESGAAK